MFKKLAWLCFCALLLLGYCGQCQQKPPLKVAVLVPLYLDSAFMGVTYKLGTNTLPKYMMPGLDFYHGVNAAIKRLQADSVQATITILDTKRADQSFGQILGTLEIERPHLILAHITNAKEQQAIQSYSSTYNIPVVSPLYPNDVGLEANPFFIMLNSTLETHLQQLYKHMQQVITRKTVVHFVTKAGVAEQRIEKEFNSLRTGSNKIFFNKILIADSLSEKTVVTELDSTKHNYFVVGSLQETLSAELLKFLQANPAYKSTVWIMPSSAMVLGANGSNFSSVNVAYTVAQPLQKNGSYQQLNTQYRNSFGGRPTDAYFRGFDATYSFIKWFSKNSVKQLATLTQQPVQGQFTQYTLKPNFEDVPPSVPQFIENKNMTISYRENGKWLPVTVP
ncbi:MAG: hypothetical protein EAZ47_11650 [Bacteroidetes bacterium]|nr:MAG: hypothetical protein EAY72_12810 [Bacteroidota bacterium]TAE69616.1 MAG: hypothetical protein EAY68_03480 [Bacteroidota bacterium]TAF89530.1 MAG: hypothetical protein EAZ47_11650 [Bacteroidota bacterium]